MAGTLPLAVLLAPMVIAGMAVVMMMMSTNEKGPARGAEALDPKASAKEMVSLTLARYVGGHPAAAAPVPTPYVVLTPTQLVLFARQKGAMLFAIDWPTVEAMTPLDRAAMEMAAAGVRGLADGALAAAAGDASFLRVRFQDTNGWWQNVIFEVSPAYGAEQVAEIESYWKMYRDRPKEPAKDA